MHGTISMTRCLVEKRCIKNALKSIHLLVSLSTCKRLAIGANVVITTCMPRRSQILIKLLKSWHMSDRSRPCKMSTEPMFTMIFIFSAYGNLLRRSDTSRIRWPDMHIPLCWITLPKIHFTMYLHLSVDRPNYLRLDDPHCKSILANSMKKSSPTKS